MRIISNKEYLEALAVVEAYIQQKAKLIDRGKEAIDKASKIARLVEEMGPIPLKDLGASKKLENILEREGLTTLDKIAEARSRGDFFRTPGIGRGLVNELDTILENYGLVSDDEN
ncbi:hypothetical protein [Runella sp.]|uniref:hypothetical protein n=1 Tax=Runella sp. TaxID=1960881 RepID=UPI003D0F3C0D